MWERQLDVLGTRTFDSFDGYSKLIRYSPSGLSQTHIPPDARVTAAAGDSEICSLPTIA